MRAVPAEAKVPAGPQETEQAGCRAFTGNAMLIAIALPLWGAASWLTERRRQQDSRDAGQREARSP